MRYHLRFFIILLGLISFSSCKPDSDETMTVPDFVLSQDKMAETMTNFYLAESAASINVLNVPGNKFDSVYVINPIKNTDVSKSQFDSSLAFYSRHPKTFKKIMDQVLENMSKIRAEGKLK